MRAVNTGGRRSETMSAQTATPSVTPAMRILFSPSQVRTSVSVTDVPSSSSLS